MPAGRPTDYRDEYAEQARKLCLLGYTDSQLADFFEVDESTVNRWKTKHLEFRESVQAGKAVADAEVASSLYSRATDGFVKTKDVKVDDEVVTLEEQLPPDVSAQRFWLMNRQRKLWAERVSHGVDPESTEAIAELVRSVRS